MKNSILTLAITVLSILSVQAINNPAYSILDETNATLFKGDIVKIFDWKVETNKGKYAGTSLSLKEAQHMISLTSKDEIIKSTELTSYYVLKSDLASNAKRNYFWEVKTNTGRASGYASSLEYARQMIKLVASGDVIVSNMVFSQPQQ